MTIPDDFGDDFTLDRHWGYEAYVRRNAGLPGAPIYTPVRKPPRAKPRKFNPRYKKAGETPTRRKKRHFNQQTFWQAVSFIGMSGGIAIVVLAVIYVMYLIERAP